MYGTRRLAVAGLVVGLLALGASTAFGQTTNNTSNNNNTSNSNGVSGFTPAGVIVSADGVLRVKQFTDRTGDLTRTRIAESRARLGAAMAKGSPLRKISLQRLEAAVAECIASGKEPTDEMKALAGLTRLQYVFYYPETKDIVIAGPAEGFFADFTGRLLGMTSLRAVVELQDLAAALRAFPPGGRATHEIGVSIDPTQEGLSRMNQFLRSIRPTPGDAAAIVEGLKEAQGMHTVTVTGVSPRTHFAQVMVEADYRMKLIGIGMEPPPVKMATYVDRASGNEALQRWYFTPNYDCVRVAEDDLAMELIGQGVKLIGASELVAATGQRAAAGGQSKASTLFCQAFTHNYPQIASRSPVYAQLRNLVDLAVAAAFIQKQDYCAQAGWKMGTLGDEKQYAIETYETPKTVEPACTAIWKGNRLMTPIGGGVQMEPLRAVQQDNRLKDEKGTVKQAHGSVKMDGLAKGQWWWD
jgi:Protein of unknown function (DUF1598)